MLINATPWCRGLLSCADAFDRRISGEDRPHRLPVVLVVLRKSGVLGCAPYNNLGILQLHFVSLNPYNHNGFPLIICQLSEKIQRSCLRLVSPLRYFHPMAHLFLNHGIQTVIILASVSSFWLLWKQPALVYIFVPWLCWRVFKRFMEKHPLDNIPGPPSPSFITGSVIITG